MEYETCVWCGLKSKKTNGVVHKYLESSPSCWAKYGELLALEYENYEYMSVHDLTVDAYALQHPGKENAQTISSVYVHLASLYSYFELNKSINELSNSKKQVVKFKKNFVWLEPPEKLNTITVVNVLNSKTAVQHCTNVKMWSEYIFKKWENHHTKIAQLITLAT